MELFRKQLGFSTSLKVKCFSTHFHERSGLSSGCIGHHSRMDAFCSTGITLPLSARCSPNCSSHVSFQEALWAVWKPLLRRHFSKKGSDLREDVDSNCSCSRLGSAGVVKISWSVGPCWIYKENINFPISVRVFITGTFCQLCSVSLATSSQFLPSPRWSVSSPELGLWQSQWKEDLTQVLDPM